MTAWITFLFGMILKISCTPQPKRSSYSTPAFKARHLIPPGCFQPTPSPHHHPFPFNMVPPVLLAHRALATTFEGVNHPLSTSKLPIQQFRGIKYASIPARFRQSKLFTSYPARTDATAHG